MLMHASVHTILWRQICTMSCARQGQESYKQEKVDGRATSSR